MHEPGQSADQLLGLAQNSMFNLWIIDRGPVGTSRHMAGLNRDHRDQHDHVTDSRETPILSLLH